MSSSTLFALRMTIEGRSFCLNKSVKSQITILYLKLIKQMLFIQ